MNQCLQENWVFRLTTEGDAQAEALFELEDLLKRRLRRAFRSNAKVDDAFVDDVVQDSIVAILESITQFQGRSKFTTWATTIAIRIAITEMRRMRWKDTSLEQLLERSTEISKTIAVPQSSEIDFEKKQLVETMHRVIDEQLTEKQKLVLNAELQGMPQEEIGRRLGSNRNAIYKLVHDARKRLKKGMIDAGYTIDDLSFFQGAE